MCLFVKLGGTQAVCCRGTRFPGLEPLAYPALRQSQASLACSGRLLVGDPGNEVAMVKKPKACPEYCKGGNDIANQATTICWPNVQGKACETVNRIQAILFKKETVMILTQRATSIVQHS